MNESKESFKVDYWKHVKRIGDFMKSFADPCDKPIYHYTSASGFQGIVESGDIRLTNIDFVNDTLDCKALQKEKDLFGEGELSFNRYIEKWWLEFLRCWKHKDKNARNYYIASFSEKPDSLEQWRAYGNICIRFDTEQLKKNGYDLYKCVYDKSKIKEWILDKANAEKWMLTDEQDKSRYIDNVHYTDRRNAAAISLIYAALIKLKHSCYKNEDEVRLVTSSSSHWGEQEPPFSYYKDPPIHFRQHSIIKVPVPYVKYFTPTEPEEECDFIEKYKGKTELQVKEEKLEKEKNQKRALLPIKEILVGPTPHQEETRLACKILLQEKGYKDVSIEISELPYRGF